MDSSNDSKRPAPPTDPADSLFMALQKAKEKKQGAQSSTESAPGAELVPPERPALSRGILWAVAASVGLSGLVWGFTRLFSQAPATTAERSQAATPEMRGEPEAPPVPARPRRSEAEERERELAREREQRRALEREQERRRLAEREREQERERERERERQLELEREREERARLEERRPDPRDERDRDPRDERYRDRPRDERSGEEGGLVSRMAREQGVALPDSNDENNAPPQDPRDAP